LIFINQFQNYLKYRSRDFSKNTYYVFQYENLSNIFFSQSSLQPFFNDIESKEKEKILIDQEMKKKGITNSDEYLFVKELNLTKFQIDKVKKYDINSVNDYKSSMADFKKIESLYLSIDNFQNYITYLKDLSDEKASSNSIENII
jgi:hypothetical protein